MRTALAERETAPQPDKYTHWLLYLTDIAGVQYRHGTKGWFWSHPKTRKPGEPRWHGPFATKDKAAVHCANYVGETAQ